LPGSSETGLLALAGTWQQYSDRLPNGVRSADQHAQRVWDANQGESVGALRALWTDGQGPAANLADAAIAMALVGTGLTVSAGIVAATKLSYGVQLALLAGQITALRASGNPAAEPAIAALMARTRTNLMTLLDTAVYAISPGMA
jgi:hypothetical protein